MTETLDIGDDEKCWEKYERDLYSLLKKIVTESNGSSDKLTYDTLLLDDDRNTWDVYITINRKNFVCGLDELNGLKM